MYLVLKQKHRGHKFKDDSEEVIVKHDGDNRGRGLILAGNIKDCLTM